jgi:biofilm PGA synthesis lipoprotein PgaB
MGLLKSKLLLLISLLFISLLLPVQVLNKTGHFDFLNQQVILLMYHHIGNHIVGKITVTPKLFCQQLDVLQKEGYRVISLDQYANFLEGKTSLSGKNVIITFDDGYESFYTYAYPELLKRHMSAANFIIVGFVGNPKEPLPRLTWTQMREMQAHGISFYPHAFKEHYLAFTYPYYQRKSCLTARIWLTSQKRWETEAEYQKRVSNDLRKAKEIMEQELGRKPLLHYAWPYGQDSPQALKIAQSVGFRYFYYTNDRLFNANSPYFYIPRFNAGNICISSQTLNKDIYKFALKQKFFS